jgi:hypothetical protein
MSEEDAVGRTPRGAEDENSLGKMRTGRIGRAIMEEGVPTVVLEEEFQYMYGCKHCGHEWSEVHDRVTGSRAQGYTGD